MQLIPLIQGDDLNLILQLCALQLKNRFPSHETIRISNELQFRGYGKVKVTVEGAQNSYMDIRVWEMDLLNQ